MGVKNEYLGLESGLGLGFGCLVAAWSHASASMIVWNQRLHAHL